VIDVFTKKAKLHKLRRAEMENETRSPTASAVLAKRAQPLTAILNVRESGGLGEADLVETGGVSTLRCRLLECSHRSGVECAHTLNATNSSCRRERMRETMLSVMNENKSTDSEQLRRAKCRCL
jgi:hypothetical protein